MTSSTTKGLTPDQSADVILYFNNGESALMAGFGWKEKVSLASSALRATSYLQSLLPDGRPLLTEDEMKAGLEYIELDIDK